MEAFLTSIYKAILIPIILFFTPVAWLIFLVGLATIIDTGFGIWKAAKLKEGVSSKKWRKGFVPKIISYCAAVMLLFTADVFLLNELTMLFISVPYISTKLAALVFVVIEVKSMDESFEKVKGWSFLKRIYEILKNIKKIKNEASE